MSLETPGTPPAADALDTDRHALLALMLTPGLGPTLVGRCLDAFGSAAATLGCTAARLGQIKGISPRTAGELKRRIDASADDGTVNDELEAVEAANCRLLHRDEPAYPRLLRLIPDPPPLLWVRGELLDTDGLALGVVGSRRCSHYGREQADRFAAQCGASGITIVSGGAYGIDISAHRAALRVHGRTVAVLGSGLGNPYPADHIPTFDQIVHERRGAVVSELPMHTSPRAENFPRRNRIISGLSLGVLVVEAATRSGALITARMCVEDHGRECMAVPGRVDSPESAGCHRILREGWAKLVTCAGDVLEQLTETGTMLQAADESLRSIATSTSRDTERSASAEAPPTLFDTALTDSQRAIFEALKEPRTLDQLIAWLELPPGQVQADLTLMEIRRVIERKNALFCRRK